ncbi:class I SAM-dependent methyltransferase [Amycolatopsis sp. NPDC004378]
MSDYILAQAPDRETERRRLALLQEYHDAPTIRGLEATGVTAGWRCLDAGAGAGSISRWLAGRVGTGGAVLAVDLDPSLLEERENLGVRRLDLRSDPLPDRAFDLVHARLVLTHLPEREEVLDRLVRAARPGGWVVVGDINFGTTRPDGDDAAFTRVADAYPAASASAGGDPALGPKLAGMLVHRGLTEIHAEAYRTYEFGGSVGSLAMSLTFERIREPARALGVTDADVDHTRARLADPGFGFFGPEFWTVRGRKSETSA